MKPKNSFATTVIRWGLAFSFFYAGVASLRSPDDWARYVPNVLTTIGSDHFFLTYFGIFQILLAVWLFTGWKRRAGAGVAIFTLAAIIVATLDMLSQSFAAVGLILSAVALYSLTREGV